MEIAEFPVGRPRTERRFSGGDSHTILGEMAAVTQIRALEASLARFSHHSFRRAFFSLGMRQAGGLWVCGDLGVGATAVGRRMTGFFGLRGPAGARILRRRCSAGSSFATLNGSRGAVCDPAVRSAAVSNAAAPAFGDFPTVRAGSPRFCGTVPDTDTPATTSRTPAAC